MAETPDILKQILRRKAREVTAAAEQVPLAEMSRRAEAAPEPRGLRRALESRMAEGEAAVIAEIKRASPSAGLLRDPFEPSAIARDYEAAEAAAISVLTDREFFQGDPAHLAEARRACGLPLLRKDFILDQYQIYEARALGADAILLIASALGQAQLVEYSGLAHHLGMDVLLEIHDAAELEVALRLEAPLVGINNRNLHTFETRLETTLQLRDRIPADCTVVTESGIRTPEDVTMLRASGVHAFLVGEAFMRAERPGEKLAALFGFALRERGRGTTG